MHSYSGKAGVGVSCSLSWCSIVDPHDAEARVRAINGVIHDLAVLGTTVNACYYGRH